ncbi:hypothetical protein Bca52824_053313 [Brassica carinata]|uniref:Uncharacterized protein n=1 Tax=Brassica carinata TaxID=52824 RepID=A0A8X7R8Q3_BRACI|nr:hypothetical protein Bca52824_053313 [Brassica carinata]
MGLIENRDPPLPSMGSLPSQSQFDDSYVSSGPTETQKSLEEGGEGDFTVAIPGMASSQVDMGLGQLELPFRSNQTIRDIRNAIDQRYPDNDGYAFAIGDGVDYMDWNFSSRPNLSLCFGAVSTD